MTMTNIQSLELKVHAQRERIPVMYGQIDFSLVPERFAQDAGDTSSLPARFAKRRPALLENRERVAMLRAYTMLGDSVADAYAALLPQYGGRRLVAMLQEACAKGRRARAERTAGAQRRSSPRWSACRSGSTAR